MFISISLKTSIILENKSKIWEKVITVKQVNFDQQVNFDPSSSFV